MGFKILSAKISLPIVTTKLLLKLKRQAAILFKKVS